MVRIRDEAIKCKENLSENEAYKVSIPFIYNSKQKTHSIDCLITRDEFDRMGRDLMDKTHDSIDVVLSDSGLTPDDSIVITDVNPYTLGIRAGNGFDFDHMSVIIKRNVTIPVTKTDEFTTSVNGQSSAKIEIYQGESSLVSSNHFLGEFTLGGIPKAPAGPKNI